MKKSHIYRVALLFLLCQFAALYASAQKVIAYATIQGVKTGTFKGSSTMKGREGKIECTGFAYAVTSPHDPASGLPTGKRMEQPVRINKQIDSSTPQLLEALYTNEDLKSVVIDFYKSSADGRETLFYTVTLTNASISAVTQNWDEKNAANNTLNETISFNFQKIEITNTEGKTTAGDDWSVVR